MSSNNELPEYLESAVAEALDYYHGNVDGPDHDFSLYEAAAFAARDQNHLWSSWSNEDSPSNFELLQELRELDALCADELSIYRQYTNSTDFADSTIEAICIRSLEELLINTLEERVE